MILLSRRGFVGFIAGAGSGTLVGCTSEPVRSTDIDPVYRRQLVRYSSREAVGTIIVDPRQHFLYFIEKDGSALRYGVGVGKEGYGWSGVATVHSKQEWPNWYPTNEYLQRQPEIKADLDELQSGVGVLAGPNNPLGARALYLWQGHKDTLYRIHGTNEPWTIGHDVSSGCIRLVNEDVIDLYDRTRIGTKVVVL